MRKNEKKKKIKFELKTIFLLPHTLIENKNKYLGSLIKVSIGKLKIMLKKCRNLR